MELDKRIKEGKRPLTCFDLKEAEQFIGKKGYFAHCIDYYEDLKSTVFGTLSSTEDGDHSSFVCTEETFDNYYYHFFIPEDWVLPEEPEKKYRVLTLNEFLERFKIGDAIYIRFKKDGAERVVVFSEYNIPPHKDEGNNTESVCLNGIEHHLKSIVCLGMREYNLTTLFDCYEYFDGKEWQPFGVIEE
jgi:hypothetical protein